MKNQLAKKKRKSKDKDKNNNNDKKIEDEDKIVPNVELIDYLTESEYMGESQWNHFKKSKTRNIKKEKVPSNKAPIVRSNTQVLDDSFQESDNQLEEKPDQSKFEPFMGYIE